MSGLAEALAAALALIGIGAADQPVAHGYAEGEYLRVASSAAGFLQELPVHRGQRIDKGAPLFTIDRAVGLAERDRLAAALAQAKAQLADLRSGKRAEEVAVYQAQLTQAEANQRLTRAELDRQQILIRTSAGAGERLDSARASYDQSVGRIAELKAQIASANLPARADQIRASEEAVRVAEAALDQQERRLAEQAPLAPAGALVENTLYNPGEWVPAGSPVVSLLPPERIKLIVYVPEPRLPALKLDSRLPVTCDGCAAGLTARVAYIAPKAEYTPPVIYSVGNREKLVFRVELVPDTPLAFAPGQPVDVGLSP